MQRPPCTLARPQPPAATQGAWWGRSEACDESTVYSVVFGISGRSLSSWPALPSVAGVATFMNFDGGQNPHTSQAFAGTQGHRGLAPRPLPSPPPAGLGADACVGARAPMAAAFRDASGPGDQSPVDKPDPNSPKQRPPVAGNDLETTPGNQHSARPRCPTATPHMHEQ
jgi:hypothetical protein